MRRKRVVGTVAAAALGMVAAAPSAASAASTIYTCDASALRATLPGGSPIEPVTANRGAATCQTVNATPTAPLSSLPSLLSVSALIAQTTLAGPADSPAQQTATSDGGLTAVKVGSLSSLGITLPPLPIPTTVGGQNVSSITVTFPLLGTATIDLTAAEQSLAKGQLPAADLLDLGGATANATAACPGGVVRLSGTGQAAGLTVLGQSVPVDQVASSAVSVIGASSLDPSSIDISQLHVIIGGTDVTSSIPLATLQSTIQPALDALPNIPLPGLDATVSVTPHPQTVSGLHLIQQGLRVKVSLLGQTIADVVAGEATVGATSAACTPAGAASLLALQCTKRRLVLTDVLERAGRVRLVGVADRSLVGRRVNIVFLATHRVVAHARVRADGAFSTTAPLPRASLRGTNRARYRAVVGHERSLGLKLRRRMIVSSVHSRGGRVTIAGTVVSPLASPRAPITVRRRISCKRWQVVKRVKPDGSGHFRVTVAGPPGQLAAVYRLTTRVRKSLSNHRTYPTFTLPRTVALH